MATIIQFFKILCMVVVSIALAAHTAKAAVSCGQVVSALSPCINYVSNGGAVPASCCNGIRGLNNAAKNTADRRTVCNCLKSAIRGINVSPKNLQLAAGLPAKCHVNIPFKIDPNTDCSRVQ